MEEKINSRFLARKARRCVMTGGLLPKQFLRGLLRLISTFRATSTRCVGFHWKLLAT